MLSLGVIEGDSYLKSRYASFYALNLHLELASFAFCSLYKVYNFVLNISWIKFHQVSTLNACNCKDFYLVLIILFYINKLSYSFNMCLDR
jgi:hypothetical protein